MPKPNTADAMKRYKSGNAGFTDKAHLKAKGLIPRADGTKKKSPKYEEAPVNATGTAVAGTGDDSSTVVVKKRKDMRDRLFKRFKIKETIDRLIPDLEYAKDEITERKNQLKAMALQVPSINVNDKSNIQANPVEDLDKDDAKTIKPIIKQLKKSVKTHDTQAKQLQKDISDDMDRQPQDKDVKKVKGTQPKKYYKTLDKATKKKRANFFKNRPKQKKSDDDDDYRPAPGDKGAKTKPSTHTKKYKQMYGEDTPANATGTAVAGTGDDSSTIVMKKKKDKETMKDRLLRRFKIKETIDRTVPDLERPKDDIKEKTKMMKSMALKANVNIDEAIKGLQNKAKKTGMPYSILKKVYDRGMAAWKGGHRPGTTQQQWAFARVNSFVTKSSGTWGKADKDLADKVRASKG